MNELIFIGAIYPKNDNPFRAMYAKNIFLLDSLNQHFGKVHIINLYRWSEKPLYILKVLLVILKHRKTKIVISASWKSTSKIMKWLCALGIKREIYYWGVGKEILHSVDSKTLDKKHTNNLKLIIVQCKEVVNKLNEYGVMNTICALNSKPIKYIPHKQKIGSNARFVFLSRVVPEKGCEVILEAVNKINEMGLSDHYCVHFYGNIMEDYSSIFRQKIKSTGNVDYKGILDLCSFDNYKTLAEYDILLFPTFFVDEGFPGVLIDAFIAGLPVIASDWNLNKDIIEDKVTGIIIPPQNTECLIETMLQFIKKEIDIEPMIAQCHKKAYLYDSNKVLSFEFYKKIGLCNN